jgi:hypothetical protein
MTLLTTAPGHEETKFALERFLGLHVEIPAPHFAHYTVRTSERKGQRKVKPQNTANATHVLIYRPVLNTSL